MDFFRVFHHTPAAPAPQQEANRSSLSASREMPSPPAAKAVVHAKASATAAPDLTGFFLWADPVGL